MIQEYKNALVDTGCSARQPVAVEVAHFTERLAKQAQELAERVNEKLHSVMTSEHPRLCEAVCKDSTEYPPLFSALRENLVTINRALESIDYALSRTEL